MKEFTSYDLAVLVYENYINLDSLKFALETSKRGIKNELEKRKRSDENYYKKYLPGTKQKIIDIDKEMQKFNNIQKQIEEIEF